MTNSPYNPFNLHPFAVKPTSIVFIKQKPVMVDLNGLISDLEMQKMDIDELDCYRSKLMNYRNITKDEEKEIKKIRRKVKNKQSSKLCRIKSKEEAKRIKSELEYLRLRCKELESKNEELMEIIRRSDSSER